MVKVAKSKIKLSLPVIVADIVYKFQIICLKRIKFNEWKLEKLVFFSKSRGITPEQKSGKI
jgi:hypothetical protein